MNWIKKGQIFEVNSENPYLISHASNPLSIHLKNDIFRVFFSARDKDNKSSVSYVDIDIVTQKVIATSEEPLLIYGRKGSFYSHGISIGNIYKGGKDDDYILFMGWQIPEDKHWRGDVGRIKVKNNKEMVLDPKLAFMGVDEEDPISLSYPYVIFHDGIYKMWYGSTIDWTSENGEMIHVIKYATSKDGENWKKHGIAIPYKIGIAQAFYRTSVMIDEYGYYMW